MPIEETLPAISEGDVEMVAIDHTPWLDDDSLLTGTPLVVEITTTDLTIGNQAVNTAALKVLGRDVAIGKAIQFSVSGQQAGTDYRIRTTATTDDTPPRKAVRDWVLPCV